MMMMNMMVNMMMQAQHLLMSPCLHMSHHPRQLKRESARVHDHPLTQLHSEKMSQPLHKKLVESCSKQTQKDEFHYFFLAIGAQLRALPVAYQRSSAMLKIQQVLHDVAVNMPTAQESCQN